MPLVVTQGSFGENVFTSNLSWIFDQDPLASLFNTQDTPFFFQRAEYTIAFNERLLVPLHRCDGHWNFIVIMKTYIRV